MISTKPGSFGFRVLALVVATPGIAVRDLVVEVLPPPERQAAPFRSAAEYSAWRKARQEHDDEARAKVSRTLGRLQEMRLIETRGAPTLSARFVHELAGEVLRLRAEWPRLLESLGGPVELTPSELQARALAHVLERRGLASPGAAAYRRLVAALVVEKRPRTTAELLGPSPSGALRRSYRELVEACVIDAPTHRWPTARGVALVEAARASSAA